MLTRPPPKRPPSEREFRQRDQTARPFQSWRLPAPNQNRLLQPRSDVSSGTGPSPKTDPSTNHRAHAPSRHPRSQPHRRTAPRWQDQRECCGQNRLPPRQSRSSHPSQPRTRIGYPSLLGRCLIHREYARCRCFDLHRLQLWPDRLEVSRQNCLRRAEIRKSRPLPPLPEYPSCFLRPELVAV